MKLQELRSAIVKKVAERLPELKEVASHPGKFNLDELKRMATRLPSVRVAIMNVQKVTELATGEREINLKLAAFVITGDQRSLPKDISAMNIVEALLSEISGNRWGVIGVSSATSIKADNLYAGNIDRQGVAIWAITWEQSVRVGENIFCEETGVLPSEVYICTDSEHFGDEEHYDPITKDTVLNP